MTDTTPVAPMNHDQIASDGEDEFNDHDSALGSEIGSDTQTLNSYITHYTWQNGRRYHAEHIFNGHYWGPNDEHANELQHLTHYLWKLTLSKKLHLAPVENAHNILDLGTGAGSWAIEMAEEYPGAHVVGTDISPIQPLFVPSNCHFEIQDITMPWTWPADHFDFIHIRELVGSIPDWHYLLRQAYDATKPGGWVEIGEHSVAAVSDYITLSPDEPFTKWGHIAEELGRRNGSSFVIWSEIKKYIEGAGFVDIVETKYKWPLNGWPRNAKLREIGMVNQLRLFNGVEDYMLRPLTRTMGWSLEDAQEFMENMKDAVMDLSTRAYLDVTVVYGRKPSSTNEIALTDAL